MITVHVPPEQELGVVKLTSIWAELPEWLMAPTEVIVPPRILKVRYAWGSSMLETAGSGPPPSGSNRSEGML
jgi:hypothetical protein